MNLSLLHTPDGVRDFYGTELDMKNHIMDCFEKNIKTFGYDEIQTPTLEFLNVFLDDNDLSFESKTFRFIDRDGETLVLRPDYTPGVARCAVKYFSDENFPRRFFYKGNAFSNKGLYEGKAIESTQMGIELFKDDSFMADFEVLTLVIKNLLSIGLEDFKIFVNTKDDKGRIDKIFELLKKMNYSEYVEFDEELDSNFKYYTGMIFKVYTFDVGESICKGGRYNSLLEKYGEGAPAVGCVFMIDNILQSLKKQKGSLDSVSNPKTYVVYESGKEAETLKKCEELRESGKNCVTVNKENFDKNFEEYVNSGKNEIIYI